MLTVYYRLTDIPSTNPSPILHDDKMKLNLLCLRSFVQAYKEVKPKMVFLCDHASEVYRMLISEICPFEKEFHFTQIGINETALLQYTLASLVEGNVLFQECDYIYKFKAGSILANAIDELQLVSPYDHKNFYIDRSIHSEDCKVKLVNNHHFRTTERNTMTFATTADNVRRHKDIFMKYGYLDSDVWHDLAAQGLPLWVPIPSLATHMVIDYLAPTIDWKPYYEAYL